MSIKRIFIVISAIFAASAVFADNSSVTSKKYVDDLMSGYQGKLPGSGANKLMIYDDEAGIVEKSIETTLVSNATGVPTVGAVKTGLDGVQDTITGTAGYVMTGTGNLGEVSEKPIYSTTNNYTDALVTAEMVNTGVTNAVNSSLIRVDTSGNPSDSGTLWEINTDLFALDVQPLLPNGYTRLLYIESTGTQYIDTGVYQENDDEFNVTYQQITLDSSYRNIFGASDTGQSKTFYISQTNSSTYVGNTFDSGFPRDTDKHTLRWVTTNASGNTINIDGQDYRFATTIDPDSTLTVKIFARSALTTQRKMIGKIYSYNQKRDGSMIRNLIPAKHNQDGVIGMYDTVSGTFFTNAGTGTFTAGPAVGN